MPEFFVPYVDDARTAEEIWEATRLFVATQGWQRVTDRRIFRLGYLNDGKHMEAEVGKPHPYAKAEEVGPGQEVLVILEHEGGPYLVCSWNRGVKRGAPILVSNGECYEATDFDS